MIEQFLNYIVYFSVTFEKYVRVPLGHLLLEIILLIIVGVLWKAKRFYPKQENLKLTREEEELLIKEWLPLPLVPENEEVVTKESKLFNGRLGHYVDVDGSMCLNLATSNFLDLVGNSEIEENSKKIILKYGVGTCGPRGFYGTTDVHLNLEKEISKFCGTEESICYSYGFSTFASAISAYAKRQDIIFADDGVCLPTQIGIVTSRSNVYWFKHGDMKHLESCLETVHKLELASPKKYKNVRKFIVVEGLYVNYGDIVDLKKIVQLKYIYKARIFLDESYSMGVLGKTGHGVTELLNVDVSDIDVLSFSFENSLASIGGVCTGTYAIIDHQRLSGLGYVFSASGPTFLCQAVMDAISYIKANQKIFERLSEISEKFHFLLKERLDKRLKIDGVAASPLLHIRFNHESSSQADSLKRVELLDSIIQKCLSCQVLLMRPKYVDEKEKKLPSPSLRIHLNSSLTQDEIQRSVNVITDSIKTVLGTDCLEL